MKWSFTYQAYELMSRDVFLRKYFSVENGQLIGKAHITARSAILKGYWLYNVVCRFTAKVERLILPTVCQTFPLVSVVRI